MRRIAAVMLTLMASASTHARAGALAATQSSSSPTVITQGGTYRGTWAGGDPNTPLIAIRTAEPVVIENSAFRGCGNFIVTQAAHANLIIRNCTAAGLNPNVRGRAVGRFLVAEGFTRVNVDHNEIDGTAGIYLHDVAGYAGPAGEAVVQILGNRVRDVNGRRSDGQGGYLPFNTRVRRADGNVENGFDVVQFVQLDAVRGVPGMEIAWNEVTNDPDRSRVEDNISVYKSGGTAASPLCIHDNLIRGGYPVHPAEGDSADTRGRNSGNYSGGGIMLGDGGGNGPGDVSAFVTAANNLVLDTTNYGIAIAAGHDLRMMGNCILSTGLLADGRPVAAQNVGAYIWDSNGGRKQIPSTFFNDVGSDNRIGWMKAGGRNDAWTPDAAAWVKNVAIAGPISKAMEDEEIAAWHARAAAAKVQVGPAATPGPESASAR